MDNILDGYFEIVEKHKEKLQENIFGNKEILAEQIVQAFEVLFEKILREQELGNKERIQAINISLLRTGFKTKGVNCIIEAFNDNWLFENNPVTYNLKLEKIFDEFYILEDYLKKDTKKFINKNLRNDIEKLVLQQFEIAIYYFIELVRYALDEVLLKDKFKEIKKEEKFCIAAGEYRDKGLIIYSESNTYEDLNSSIIYLDQMKTLRGRCFKKLHFQDKEYIFHDLIGNIFDESSFENMKLEKCALSQAGFKNCSIKNTSFKGSILHDTFFNNSHMEKVNLEKVYAENIYDGSKSILTGCLGLQFINSKIQNCSFKNSILNGSDFRYALLEEVDFTECELRQADFRNADFKNVDFSKADLKDSYFNEKQLSAIDLSDEQLNSIKLG